MQIIAISGSLRAKSLNTSLLRAVAKCAPQGCNIELESINEVPLYNEDDVDKNGIPECVTYLKEKIKNSDGVLISTPEYNHGIPGVIKNTIDWLTRPAKDVPSVFGNRKFGIIGASPSRLGTAFAQTAWLPVLRFLNTHTYFGDQLFVARAHTVFNEDGELIDELTREFVKKYIDNFCRFIEDQ